MGALCVAPFSSSSSSISDLPRKISLSSGNWMVCWASLNVAALPTGFLPSRRLASTRRRIRSCSRPACQSCHLACAFCRIPSFPTAPTGPRGPVTHACELANEKLVVKNVAVTSKASETMYAPALLKPARRALASSVPSIPPAGSAPRTSGKGTSANSGGSDSSNNPYPKSMAFCDSTCLLRNHFSPSQNTASGNRNAAYPSAWNMRSALYAPTGPITLCGGASLAVLAETLNDASAGQYVNNAAAIKTASVRHKNPISSLSRLLPVGVRKRTRSPQLFGEG